MLPPETPSEGPSKSYRVREGTSEASTGRQRDLARKTQSTMPRNTRVGRKSVGQGEDLSGTLTLRAGMDGGGGHGAPSFKPAPRKSRQFVARQPRKRDATLSEAKKSVIFDNAVTEVEIRENEVTEVTKLIKEREWAEKDKMKRLQWEKDHWRAPHFTLTYVNYLRTEAVRLLLLWTNTPFDEKQAGPRDECCGLPLEWGILKFVLKGPLEKFTAYNPWAFMRHWGKKNKLYPMFDLGEQAEVDDTMTSLTDFTKEYYKKTSSKKIEEAAELLATRMMYFETKIQKTVGPWLFQRMYVCDFELIAAVKLVLSAKQTDEELFRASFPNVLNIYERVSRHKFVREYDKYRRKID